jgi:hypothetical protein
LNLEQGFQFSVVIFWPANRQRNGEITDWLEQKIGVVVGRSKVDFVY